MRQERHAVKYLHTGVDLATSVHFIERISGDRLARNLHLVQQPVFDELRSHIDTVFGKDGDSWKEINVYQSLQVIVMAAINRTFLGLPLCRHPHLVESLNRYILALGLGTIFVGELPRSLKAVAAWFVKLPLAYYRRRTLNILTPAVEHQITQAHGTGKGNTEGQESNFIRSCAKVSEKNTVGGIGRASDPSVIAEWIMHLVRFGPFAETILIWVY